MSARDLRPRAPRPQAPAAAAAPNRRRQQAPAAADPADADPADAPGPAFDFDSGEDGDEETIADLPRDQKPREDTDSAIKKEASLTAHFRNLSKEVQGAAILVTKLLDQQSQQARQLLENIPVPKEADALTYIPEDPGTWSNRDEATLLRRWEESPECQALTAEVKGTHPMWTMWKTWLRLMHTAPSCFISAQNGLQYEKKLPEDALTPDPNWSKDFCNRLRKLACHGIFRECPELLLLALLWVPICRQDYRGPIRWQNPTSDALLSQLVRKMRRQDGSKTVQDLHTEVRGEYGPRGPRSAMSDLLQGIEKRVFAARPADDLPARPESMPVFDISAADLRVVKKAANAVKTFGFAVFYPMAVSWRVVATSLAAGSVEDYPKTDAQLQRLRNAAALSVQRYLTRPPPDDADQSIPDLGHMAILVPVPAPVDDDDDPFGGLGDNPIIPAAAAANTLGGGPVVPAAEAAAVPATDPASIPAGRPRQVGLKRSELSLTALPFCNGNKVTVRLEDQAAAASMDVHPGRYLLSSAIASNGIIQPQASAVLQNKHETLRMEELRLP